MKKMSFRRLIAMLLALMMLVSAVPLAAAAEASGSLSFE